MTVSVGVPPVSTVVNLKDDPDAMETDCTKRAALYVIFQAKLVSTNAVVKFKRTTPVADRLMLVTLNEDEMTGGASKSKRTQAFATFAATTVPLTDKVAAKATAPLIDIPPETAAAPDTRS